MWHALESACPRSSGRIPRLSIGGFVLAVARVSLSSAESMKPLLHILTGPTAVGKTEWALRWAERYDAEIVSCDSLLFYRGMNIGTAKPSAAELARVRHHLIDICEIAGTMDVTKYVARAHAAIADIRGRDRNVLVTGGSGFYLRTYFASVADDVEVSPAIREQVARLPLQVAVEQLRNLNPAGIGTLDTANPRRVQRALERCLASGRQWSELAEEFARRPSPFAGFEVRLTRLDRTPDSLNQRIEHRVARMLRDGLVDEVRRLRERGLERNPSAARAIGYREVLALLGGAIEQNALAAEIVRNTRALVKKQRTWFRTQLPAHRVVAAETLTDEAELFAG
jgi:tRNA dimethylallyltransferase